MTIQTKNIDKQHIIYHQPVMTKSGTKSDVRDNLILLNGSLFNPQYLLHQQKVYRQAMGRGQTYFFKHEQQDYVLKHYWRGGLVGKLNADFYFWNPFNSHRLKLQQTRAYQEFTLLISLSELSLPAPAPIAARISRSLLGYRADIITATLVDTQSLVQSLTEAISDKTWFDIGATIALFHWHNVYHDDLNANNILINSDNKIFIIDFDKGKIYSDTKVKSVPWRSQNLQRLLRSLIKEKAKNNCLRFNDKDWQKLLKGYQSRNSLHLS
jgi:3-deoxy-D-manno-octulosonic acid kinase